MSISSVQFTRKGVPQLFEEGGRGRISCHQESKYEKNLQDLHFRKISRRGCQSISSAPVAHKWNFFCISLCWSSFFDQRTHKLIHEVQSSFVFFTESCCILNMPEIWSSFDYCPQHEKIGKVQIFYPVFYPFMPKSFLKLRKILTPLTTTFI